MRVETPKHKQSALRDFRLLIDGFRRDYTCGTGEGEEIVQTTNPEGALKNVAGKLSRGSQVRVLPGAPNMMCDDVAVFIILV